MAGDRWGGQTNVARAPRPDAFALKNSGLHAFLYADVGTELNGSALTMLSALARLGNDPWAQAASWAAMPRAAAVESLSQSIAQMPLVPAALMGNRDIAARLAEFLPAKARTVIPAGLDGATPANPSGQTVLMIWCGIAAWAGLTLLLTYEPATGARSAGPSMAAAGSIATVVAPSPSHAADAALVHPVLPEQRTQAR